MLSPQIATRTMAGSLSKTLFIVTACHLLSRLDLSRTDVCQPSHCTRQLLRNLAEAE